MRDMSAPILELNANHIGTRVTVVDKGSIEVTGILFSVRHEADKISNVGIGPQDEMFVGRRWCRINIGGRADIELSEFATFTYA
jgi:hypothetical protein